MEQRSDSCFFSDMEENWEHYNHANEKHPAFTNVITDYTATSIVNQLRNKRWWLVESERIGKLSADDVLRCEILETYEAFLKKDYESAIYEARDAIAVLERMIDWFRKEQDKKIAEQNKC